MTTRKKLTAANDDFLRGVKGLMNGKIYQRVLDIVNAADENPVFGVNPWSPARDFLQAYFNRPITVDEFEQRGRNIRDEQLGERIGGGK